ncbi:hypothetical protein EON79_03970 [bacterium]|nr:MAG: hypothetical protein EON79_03970 [bacterium]
MRPFLLFLPLALLAGCSERERAQATDTASKGAKSVAVKAKGMVESLWISAQREAQTLTAASGETAIRAARSKMLDLQSEMAEIKAPSELQALQLTNIETQISRLEAALEMKELKAQMARVEEGKARWRALQTKYEEAQENYASAVENLAEFKGELERRGVPMPK